MRAQGFAEDAQSSVICRWRHAGLDLTLDAMPTDSEILGFSNRWQAAALPHAVERLLPSGARIRAITPPYLLATKLEAFSSRGRGDLLGSRDFEDLISLVDGRDVLKVSCRRPVKSSGPRLHPQVESTCACLPTHRARADVRGATRGIVARCGGCDVCSYPGCRRCRLATWAGRAG